MKKSLLLLFTCLLFSIVAEAQTRYLQPIYTAAQIRRTDSVTVGFNKSMLTFYLSPAQAGPFSGRSFPQLQHADVYQPPTTDVETKRPLVIFLHTGNFLPVNLVGPSGSLRDSVAIEICTRFARMGYVAASADYRLGWSPTLVQEEARRLTLINASYRGIQDVRSCIRFFKKNATAYGIDTNKIILFGAGTGGYLSLGAATLDTFSKIPNTEFGPLKFFYNGTPMINEARNGNIFGTSFGVVPLTSVDTFTKAGDTLCIPNNLGATSDFQMQVNLGGALGDLTWIDAKSVPMLSFHAPYDKFAPYTDGVLFVGTPASPQPVLRVQGADSVIRKMTRIGRQNVFRGLLPAYDPYKSTFEARAGTVGGPAIGLFPILGDTTTDVSPWEFWAANNPKNAEGLAGSPRSTPARARLYIDTIMNVVLPRACLALNLPCRSIVSSTEELLQGNNVKLNIAPNPAQSAMVFESEVYNPIQAIELFDLSGRSVKVVRNINNSFYQLDRGTISNGMYIAKVKFEGGILSKKIVFEER